jgi:hypothetical protein
VSAVNPPGDGAILGVDFSGAAKAGRKIWIARGFRSGDRLRIDSCDRASDLTGSGAGWAQCQAWVVNAVTDPGTAIAGLDFPFGLPEAVLDTPDWEAFVLSFGDWFRTPDAFRNAMRQSSPNELRRATDIAERTPFSPWNLRLYRQTYYGIRDVLAPIVRENLGRILPMQAAQPGLPILIEICPASTLRRLRIRGPYKGRRLSEERKAVLSALETATGIDVPEAIRDRAIEDREGDAVDAIVAAEATHRALHTIESGLTYLPAARLEGFVFA